MSIWRLSYLSLTVLAASLQPAMSAPALGTAGPIKAGYGRTCITPPMGTAAGKGIYGTLKTVIEDIYARAVFIEAGEGKVLICAADVVGLYPDDVDYLTARITLATGLTREQIIIHATHNHSSPGCRWEIGRLLEPFGLGEANASSRFRTILTDGLVQAATEAVNSAEPCVMGYSDARVTGVASNRRVPVDGTGKVVMRNSRPKDELRHKPEGVIDPLVRIALFRSKSGRSLIGVCNYCCHPSAAGGDLGECLSADFPGYGMRMAEREIKGLKLMHLTGTCGDINPGAHVKGTSVTAKSRKNDIELIGGRYGEALITAVKTAGEWTDSAEMRLSHAQVSLPLSADRLPVLEYQKRIADAAGEFKRTGKPPAELHRLLQYCHAGLRSRKGLLPTRIAAMRLGGISFTFLPGEIFLRFGEALRGVAKGHLLNTAICHDYSVNYVVPPECFDEGGYEPTATRLAPEAYGVLLDASKKLLSEVQQ